MSYSQSEGDGTRDALNFTLCAVISAYRFNACLVIHLLKSRPLFQDNFNGG